MQLQFYKYQGTGNDFILIDNRTINRNFSVSSIQKMCDRKFGVGADGLMLLQNKTGFDFEMKYYNSDGNESSMCGNGGRCIVQFAHDLGMEQKQFKFWAIDGTHHAIIQDDSLVYLGMNDTSISIHEEDTYVLNTGSPHYVSFFENIKDIDVKSAGASIRNSKPFNEVGINVNFVEIIDDETIFVRTYERGVEDETLSCGTGVVASVISYVTKTKSQLEKVNVKTMGGNLHVKFKRETNLFKNIELIGPATFVFKGEYSA